MMDFDEKRPRVLVVGAGAIGSFYGGKLAQVGARVSLVCRSGYETIREGGICVSSPLGDFRFVPERVVRSAADFGDFPDYVLVATKVVPGAETVGLIKNVVGPESAIVLIQNGVEIEEPVSVAFPANELISCLAFIAVSRIGPGCVEHYDYGRLTIGSYPRGVSEKVRLLRDLLRASGVPCELAPDIVTARWQKLVWNAPFNPISVLANGADTRAILESKESEGLVQSVMEEVLCIAKAVGHELPPSIMERNIEGTLAMKPYKTSMLLDFEAGRPMEVEAILGNAVRAARRCGVSVPHMETLYALLQLVDRKSRR